MSEITVDLLRKVEACTQQIQLFEQLFPEGVTPTVALCVEHASKFDWDFAARKFLSAPAWAQYEAAKAPAWAQYEAAKAPALAQYEAATAQAWAEQWIAQCNTAK